MKEHIRHTYVPLLLLATFLFSVQFSQPLIVGADGFIHGRMAVSVARQGFVKSLPQAHFSWFNTEKFSDKDFLYHLYLVPFTTVFGYIPGTKIGAYIASIAVAWSVYMLLSMQVRNRFMSLASVALLFSSQYLRDSAEARPFTFALLLTVWGIYVISRKYPVWVLIISLIYGMTHLSSWVLPLYAVLFSVYTYMMEGKGEWKVIAYSTGGYILSFFLHPNFPHNVFNYYLNGILVPFYAAKTGILELGAEFFPLYTHVLLRFFPLAVGGFILIYVAHIGNHIQAKEETKSWGIAAVLFLFLGLYARKNFTHAYPVVVLWLGLSFDDWFSFLQKEMKTKRERIFSVFVPVGICVILVSAWLTLKHLKQALLAERVYGEHFYALAKSIQQTIPTGQRIFHANWSDSQYLIGLAPEYEYIVTLDPIYMYSYDQPLYALYRQISVGQNEKPYEMITTVFQSAYVYAGKNYFLNFIHQLRNDSRSKVLAEDELGVLFALQK